MSSSVGLVKNGVFTGKGADKKIILGWKPKSVKFHNVTDRIQAEKSDTMANGNALVRDAAGAGTFPADRIELNSDGFTIKAALAVSAKECHYEAHIAHNDN